MQKQGQTAYLVRHCHTDSRVRPFSEVDVHDAHDMDHLVYELTAYYIFDRAYVGFNRLYTIMAQKAFFVVRAKSNLKLNRMYSRKVDRSTGVKTDKIGKLSGFYAAKDYPGKIRRVKSMTLKTTGTLCF